MTSRLSWSTARRIRDESSSYHAGGVLGEVRFGCRLCEPSLQRARRIVGAEREQAKVDRHRLDERHMTINFGRLRC